MAPGDDDREVHEKRRCAAIPKDFSAIGRLIDADLRGVAAARTYLSRRTVCLGLVEGELVRRTPGEDRE